MKCLQACRGFCSVNAHSSAWGVNFNAWGRQTGSQGPGEVVHPGQEGWGKAPGDLPSPEWLPPTWPGPGRGSPKRDPQPGLGIGGEREAAATASNIIPKVGGEARVLEDCCLHPDAPAPGSLVLTANSARPPSAHPVQARGPGQAARSQAQCRRAPRRRHGGGAGVGGPRPRVRGEGAGAGRAEAERIPLTPAGATAAAVVLIGHLRHGLLCGGRGTGTTWRRIWAARLGLGGAPHPGAESLDGGDIS